MRGSSQILFPKYSTRKYLTIFTHLPQKLPSFNDKHHTHFCFLSSILIDERILPEPPVKGMKNMLFTKNEKGVTLVEVLAAFALLSVVFISILNFIPQMGFMNQHNKDKIQSVNSAKEVLVKWQDANEVRDFIENPLSLLPNDVNDDIHYYKYIETEHYHTFLTTKNDFDVEIKIKKISDLTSLPNQAHQIQVQFLNKNGTIVSESYGYVMIE
jgi:hypothetical protein